jgi:predicted CXXCH cytochrome family protein
MGCRSSGTGPMRTIRSMACRVAAACLLAAAVSGCTSPTGGGNLHTFVFPDAAHGPAGDERRLTAAERMQAQRMARIRANFRQPSIFVHAPRASNECEGCHVMSSGPGMFGRGSSEAKPRVTPNLARPITSLCLTCHSDKSAKSAQAVGLAVHRPVEEGRCVLCHHPHAAGRQYMLLGTDSVALCLSCHGEDDRVAAGSAHAEDPQRDCLECHNPHVGKTPRLLKTDFDEWQLYDGFVRPGS